MRVCAAVLAAHASALRGLALLRQVVLWWVGHLGNGEWGMRLCDGHSPRNGGIHWASIGVIVVHANWTHSALMSPASQMATHLPQRKADGSGNAWIAKCRGHSMCPPSLLLLLFATSAAHGFLEFFSGFFFPGLSLARFLHFFTLVEGASYLHRCAAPSPPPSWHSRPRLSSLHCCCPSFPSPTVAVYPAPPPPTEPPSH